MHTYRDLFAKPEFRVLFITQCLTMIAGATSGAGPRHDHVRARPDPPYSPG